MKEEEREAERERSQIRMEAWRKKRGRQREGKA